MNSKTKAMTKYFRSAVAAEDNIKIDFGKDKYYNINLQELAGGIINSKVCNNIFEEKRNEKNHNDDKATLINVIICPKTIRTVFDSNKRVQDKIEELTGVFYIPAILNLNGTLSYDNGNKKLPWFPREYLNPMLEFKLAVGLEAEVDKFMSDNVGEINKIKTWKEYTMFFKDFYEQITESKFEDNVIRNMDDDEPFFQLEDKIYIFLDKTIHSTFHILKLYDYLLKDNSPKALYEKFISTNKTDISPLIKNNFVNMQNHSGQMGGEYGLSPSQRRQLIILII